MSKETISKSSVDALVRKALGGIERLYLHDTKVTGFVAMATPTGAVSYLFRYRHGGRTLKVTLGKHGPLTPDQARDLAKTAAHSVHAGRDPQAEKKAKRQALSRNDFASVVESFIKLFAEPKRNRSAAEVRKLIDRDATRVWGKRPIAGITRQDALQLIDEVQERSPSSARVLFVNLRTFFKWCVQRGLIERSPMADLSPPPRSKDRDRVLSNDELRYAWHGCEEIEHPFGPLFHLLILTLQRRDEVAGMHKIELDLSAKTWIVPAARAKNGIENVVPLSDAAITLIRPLYEAAENSGLLFSTNDRTPVSGFSKAKRRLEAFVDEGMQTGGVKPLRWTLHDLRRTAATGMASLGVPPHIVEQVLNHKSGTVSGVAAVYNRFNYMKEKREALDAWAKLVCKIAAEGDETRQAA
ncbi:MAG: hypothetical protein QOC72_3933 [Methylobacteriaceae bacterium]|jgi:integrase|nr:hypothetical protein [Methylobacteriaceae bacterium]